MENQINLRAHNSIDDYLVFIWSNLSRLGKTLLQTSSPPFMIHGALIKTRLRTFPGTLEKMVQLSRRHKRIVWDHQPLLPQCDIFSKIALSFHTISNFIFTPSQLALVNNQSFSFSFCFDKPKKLRNSAK